MDERVSNAANPHPVPRFQPDGQSDFDLPRRSLSNPDSEKRIYALAILYLFLPPLVAIVAWPALYFTLFLVGILVMPVVLLACVIWAWPVSVSVSKNILALSGKKEPNRANLLSLQVVLLLFQLLVIIASWPLFGLFLTYLESLGLKTGWG
jgi:hypothetical protein